MQLFLQKHFSSLYNEWGEVSIPILLAIAHHHSPYSQEYERYKIINDYKNVIDELSLPEYIEKTIDKNKESKISDKFEFEMPYIGYETQVIPYRFYSFTSKILRLCDWIASCGKNAIIFKI